MPPPSFVFAPDDRPRARARFHDLLVAARGLVRVVLASAVLPPALQRSRRPVGALAPSLRAGPTCCTRGACARAGTGCAALPSRGARRGRGRVAEPGKRGGFGGRAPARCAALRRKGRRARATVLRAGRGGLSGRAGTARVRSSPSLPPPLPLPLSRSLSLARTPPGQVADSCVSPARTALHPHPRPLLLHRTSFASPLLRSRPASCTGRRRQGRQRARLRAFPPAPPATLVAARAPAAPRVGRLRVPSPRLEGGSRTSSPRAGQRAPVSPMYARLLGLHLLQGRSGSAS